VVKSNHRCNVHLYRIKIVFYSPQPRHKFKKKNKIKSSLYSLDTLSGVTSERCPTPRLCTRTNISRLQQWRVVCSVWEICSARHLNPIPPAPEADVLPLVPSDRCHKFISVKLNYFNFQEHSIATKHYKIVEVIIKINNSKSQKWLINNYYYKGV